MIPTEVKIQGFIWNVVESEGVTTEGRVFGSIHFQSQTIYLDPSTTPQKKEQCLLHEILHAIVWQSGLDSRMREKETMKELTEEEIVQAISMLLYQVLKENQLTFLP